MEEACQNISFLRDLDMKAKWTDPEFAPSKDVLYKYMANLVLYSRMNFEVDKKLMRAVEETAAELAADIKSGKRDVRSIDLEEIGVKAIRRLEDGEANDPRLLSKINALLELLCDNPVFTSVVDSVLSNAKK